jgi:RHS repeat-associated protein
VVTYYTDWVYNDSERTVTVTDGGIYPVVWTLNGWDEAVSRTDGLGNERRYEYDGSGKIIKEEDSYGNATEYHWNAIGKIAGISYADATTTAYQYNHTGQVVKITDSTGGVWEGIYDAAGRLWKETGRPGINREYRYDNIGRVVEVRNGGTVTERYQYQERGRVITYTDGNGAEYRYERNSYGEMITEINRLGDRQAYSYDREGRVNSLTEFSGKQVQIIYSDNTGTVTTRYADGTEVRVKRDRAGNIIYVHGESGDITYRYDAGGKLIYEYDEKAREQVEYQYDKAGRRTAMVNGNRNVRYEYGKNGELLKVYDNTQRLQASYRYDVMGREIQRTYGNGITQETQYDQSGRTILIIERDLRREIIRAEGYLYDAQGRRSHSVDEQGRITKYVYDGQSRLSEVWYPYTETKKNADRQEAAEAGLHVTPNQGQGFLYNPGAVEVNALRTLLNRSGGNRGGMVAASHVMWKEEYRYDGNGNRMTKTTPWGTVSYQYDRENRLTSRGTIAYSYDQDGNLLTEKGSYREAEYRYNEQHRMVYSAITDVIKRTRVSTSYQYDAFGRRTITQQAGQETMRTLYDAFTFEVIREGVTYVGGTFTTQFETGRLTDLNTGTEGSRYRWIGEGTSDGRYRYIGDEAPPTRYTGISVTLYGRGEAVAVNRTGSNGSRGGTSYLGKDILGSVRSTTNGYGVPEDRYEYDAFGKPYAGDFSNGMDLGYTGKAYDEMTGLYNYGYRDYAPVAARFMTVDPIRDGDNWFSYVNNDPVNWVDLWGLSASDNINTATLSTNNIGQIDEAYRGYRMQNSDWASTEIGNTTIGAEGCKVTGASQIISTITGTAVTPDLLSELTDSNGNLSQNAITKEITDRGITVISDFWQNQLNINTLNTIKNDSSGTTYILVKANVGGGIGQHWVIIENFSAGPDGTITYTVNGTSNGDTGRTYTSGSNNNSSSQGTIIRIETYTIPNE